MFKIIKNIIVTTNYYKMEDKIKQKKNNNDSQIVIRLPKDLKEEFKEALLKNDAIQSNVLRRCIREYINKNKQIIRGAKEEGATSPIATNDYQYLGVNQMQTNTIQKTIKAIR